jgi:DNA-binding CsgD family transcriptional regulator/tetratricopeptide (TPR) repeat protein
MPSASAPGRDAEGVPAAVSAAIAAELEGLDEVTRRVAQAAAVAGDPFELDVAVAAAAVPETEVLDAVDRLIARDLVRAGDVPRRFRFRHPLVRSAVYASATPGLRLVAHERAAEALAERGAPATVRAHHVEQSARHGDLAAVEVLREAGAATASRAPSSAARWLSAALRILPPSAGPAARTELLMPLAVALAATGRLEEARAALVETLALDVDAPSIPRVAVVSACANIEQLLGRRQEAHDRLIAALDDEPDPASTSRAALMVSLALDGFLAVDYEAMVTWAERAATVTESLHHRPLRAAALAILAFAQANAGPIDAAREHATQAAALVDAMDDDELALRIDAISHLGGAEYLLERLDACIAHGRRGLAVARATGQGDLFPTLTSALGGALFLSGRLDEAAEHLDAAIEMARLTDNAMALGLALLNRAYNTMVQGDVEAALRIADEAVERSRGLPGGVTATWAGAIQAVVLYEAGEHERAITTMRGVGGESLERVPSGMRAVFGEIVVRSALALGRHEEAAQAVRDAEAAAEVYGLGFPTASALRSRAALALADGDTATAVELGLQAVERTESIGARVEAGRSRLLAAEAVVAAGDEDRAAALLERAAADFEACGAVRHRDMAERELRRLGRAVHRRSRPGRADATGIDSLTGRELEVARLVVDRRTNPEIADELFLSIKTVESHMRNIFRKLGASSRVEVARMLERATAAP